MAEEKHNFRFQLVVAAIILLVGWFAGWDMAKNHFREHTEMVTDTLIVEHWDTVTIEKPTEKIRYVQRFDTIRLTDEPLIVVKIDSTAIIPIECAIYKDSTEKAKYEAFLSGFRPQLDSINIECLQSEKIITIEKPQKRFGVGIQAGVGAAKNGFSPYIGIGVQYRLW